MILYNNTNIYIFTYVEVKYIRKYTDLRKQKK
jgi:hypothetical protein